MVVVVCHGTNCGTSKGYPHNKKQIFRSIFENKYTSTGDVCFHDDGILKITPYEYNQKSCTRHAKKRVQLSDTRNAPPGFSRLTVLISNLGP